jgi:CDP-diacylglycerol--glycerol-3-phosphate 3-phosphatidyltransferase
MTEEIARNDLQIDNLPNRLTIFRIFLIPIVLTLLYCTTLEMFFEQKNLLGWVAGWIFSLASFTDFLDGYIARKRNLVTVFGSFIDPIADKFLTVSCLIMLQSLDRIPSFIVIVLVLREMYMTSLRLLANNEGVNVPVSSLGKWKTATQMLGIPFIMAFENWNGIPMYNIGICLIYFACLLSLWSAFQYTYGMIQKLKQKKSSSRIKNQEPINEQ